MEKTKRDLAGMVEEAAAGMRQLMAAVPGSGTGGAQAQHSQQAASRLFEGVMATNKRFADALLDRAGPGPAVELQRRFVGEYFDALAQGGTLLLRAAGEAAGQSSERQNARTRRPRSRRRRGAHREVRAGPDGPSPQPPADGAARKREARSGEGRGVASNAALDFLPIPLARSPGCPAARTVAANSAGAIFRNWVN